MNLSLEIAKAAERGSSLVEIVGVAVAAVAREARGSACAVYLLEPGEAHPRLFASSSPLAPARGEEMAARSVARMDTERGDDQDQPTLSVPMMLRGRPVGALVVEAARGHALSLDEAHAVESAAAQLVGIIVNARIIEAIEARGAPLLAAPGPEHAEGAGGEVVVHGAPACAGIGIGTAAFRGVHGLAPDVRAIPARGVEAERARLRDALVKTRNDIARLQVVAARDIDEEHALIFGAHLLLMNDPVLLDRMDRAIAAGASAPVAIDDALGELEHLLGATPDAYLQERVDDIDDLRGRLLSHVLGGGRAAPHEGKILVTKRMPPSLVVELKTERARGIVTELGAATSHGALLARALGIPAVTGVADLLGRIHVGDEVIVDGERGEVILRPDAATVEAHRTRAEHAARLRTEHARYRDVPLTTADGVRIGGLANVAVASDLAAARDNGAEGVGLYRTEFPFIIREHFPTREEQARIYRRAYEAFPDGPISFRVLDLGGDKFLPGSSLGAARSPFHGYRGIRVLFDHPHILRDQIQAFALAAAGRPLRILIPMVTSLDELRRMKALIAEAIEALPAGEARRPPLVGAMIEAPAAVEIAADLAREVDYLSMGTNDLVQYALVIDRGDARMSSPRDAYHPAILRMVRRTVIAAHAAGKTVSVCGEMASHGDLAAALAALGVDALSVVPSVIPELKQAFAGIAIRKLAAAMDDVLACSDAQALDAALRAQIAAARE
jgi:phosphotransferase system enzyme I (PtsP)